MMARKPAKIQVPRKNTELEYVPVVRDGEKVITLGTKPNFQDLKEATVAAKALMGIYD